MVKINAGGNPPPSLPSFFSPSDCTWALSRSMAQASVEIGLGISIKTHAQIHFHSSPDAWHEEYAHRIPHGFPRSGRSTFPRCSPLSISSGTGPDDQDLSATPASMSLLRNHSGIAMWPREIPLGIPSLPLVQWVMVSSTFHLHHQIRLRA